MHAITPPIITHAESAAPPPAAFEEASLAVSHAVGDADHAAWSRFVTSHVQSSIFHDPRWADAVQDAFGHTARHLIARRDGRVVGVLPLIEVRSFFGGRMLVSVPYGTLGGIVCDDAAACSVLTEHAKRLAGTLGANVLQLRSERGNAPGLEAVEGYVGFRKSLPDRVEDVAGFLPQHARAAARIAETRNGATVRHGDALLPDVWTLYARSMRRLASINYPLSFFESLRRRFREQFWVTAVFAQGRPVCGVITLVHRTTASPYVFGSDDRIRCDGAANLLYRSVMERAVACGLSQWDFGRSRADNRGAVGFKKNQGFKPQPLGYQQYVPAGRVPHDLRPTSARFALARRIWPRLPLAVTQALGAWLSRSLPG